MKPLFTIDLARGTHFVCTALICLCLPLFSSAQGTCGDAVPNDVYTSPVTTYTIAGPDAAFNQPSCSIDGDDAIWISVDIPSNAAATLLTITMTTWGGCSNGIFFCATDLTMGIYSGSCSSLTTIDPCLDMSVFSFGIHTGTSPWTIAVTPGTTYYFRISEEDDQGGFADLLFELDSYLLLPVELTNFDGESRKGGTHLTWATATEYNTEYFEVERSQDGVRWETVGLVDAVGFSDAPQAYQFEDDAPLREAYYRLRIVDFDGWEEFSKVVHVSNQYQGILDEVIQIFPNPSSGRYSVQWPEGNPANSYRLINLQGQLIEQGNWSEGGESSIELNITHLPNGIYLFQWVDGSGTYRTERLHKTDLRP